MTHSTNANNESRIKTFTEIRTKLKHYQTENALQMLSMEDSGVMIPESNPELEEIVGPLPYRVSAKFGLLANAKSFGKKRTMIAAIKASYNDILDAESQATKATSKGTFCVPRHPFEIVTPGEIVKTTLVILNPNKVLGWRTDMEELGVPYFAVEGKDDFNKFFNKNGGKDPEILICSVNIYRKFINRTANFKKLWRRVIFEAKEPGYNNHECSVNLRACFFWTTDTIIQYPSGKYSNQEIYEKALVMNNAIIGDKGQDEEKRKYRFNIVPISYRADETVIGVKHAFEKEEALDFIEEKTEINEERLDSIEEDIEEGCVICDETQYSKAVMLCCSQMSCISCIKKHIRSSSSNPNSFNCMFCRASSSTQINTVLIKSSGEDELPPVHPVLAKIGEIRPRKALVVVESRQSLEKVVQNFPEAITYKDINTFPRITKICSQIAVKQQYMIVLTFAEFSKIHSHKIFSKATDVVNSSGTYIFPRLMNPSRDPRDNLNIYSMTKE